MATYLVTQATGHQSQWVITHLLAAGAKVHAVVRNRDKIPPILEKPDVTVFQGESTNFDLLLAAAQGCRGVFLNTFPIPGLEGQQARTVVEACQKAGVEQIVAATTIMTDKRALWDNHHLATSEEPQDEYDLRGYFLSKTEVEDAVRGGSFQSYTILRPAFIHIDYMLPNCLHNYPALSTHGRLDHSYHDGVRMPHTDASDVGRYAAAAFQDPVTFGGQEIDLGNEALTMQEIRDILVRVSGRSVSVHKRTPEEVEQAKATLFSQRFHLWANVHDLSDSPVVAREVEAKFGIPLTSFEMAIRRDKAGLMKTLPE